MDLCVSQSETSDVMDVPIILTEWAQTSDVMDVPIILTEWAAATQTSPMMKVSVHKSHVTRVVPTYQSSVVGVDSDIVDILSAINIAPHLLRLQMLHTSLMRFKSS